MAQSSSPPSVATLRAITYRICSTPAKHLPPVAAQLAGSIWNCKDILSAGPQSQSEASNITHRFKTTITSLLQDRTIEGRWAAVVLTKATIEAGGVATLTKSNGWVKSLVAILRKPDPPSTRQLAVITLTRIFMLTWDYSNLVREITTPALPAFISICLANVERERCSAAELETILEAFGTLIARHPTVFRTHESQIRTLLLRILSAPSSSAEGGSYFSKNRQQPAAGLLVLLHHCTPKGGASQTWEETLKAMIDAAHATCNQVFRSVTEESQTNGAASNQPQHAFSEVGSAQDDALGLAPWTGIFAGSERLKTLLEVLKFHLTAPTADSLTIRIGLFVELVSRIMDLTLEIEADSSRFNHQIAKDEREALFCVLPDIHVATLENINAILNRFGCASTPFVQPLLELTRGVFSAERSVASIRVAVYTALKPVLDIVGPSMSKADVAELEEVMMTCCKDLLPSNNADREQSSTPAQMDIINDIASKIPSTTFTQPARPAQLSGLTYAATALLTSIATKINPSAMTRKLRVQIERTAILTRNKGALVACVLNPAAKHAGGKLEPSILPILAREFPDVPEVEALLRPRMVPIAQRNSDDESFESDSRDGQGVADVAQEAFNNGFRNITDPGETERSILSLDDTLPTHVNPSANLDREEDDLYSLTPPRNPAMLPRTSPAAPATATATGNAPMDNLNAVKRSAEADLLSTDLPAKRTRMAPAGGLLGDVEAPTEPRQPQRREAEEAGVPEVKQTALRNDPESKPKDLQMDGAVALTGNGAVGATTVQHDDMGSDDSEFELPPLTMESDTDPENEEEHDEDDAEE